MIGSQKSSFEGLCVVKRNGIQTALDIDKIRRTIEQATQGYDLSLSTDLLVQEVVKTIFDGITTEDIEKAMMLAAAACIEKDPDYAVIAARLLLQKLRKEVIPTHKVITAEEYKTAFKRAITSGVEAHLLDARMLTFDLEYLAQVLCPERDALLGYVGLFTLYERYLLKIDNRRVELPQLFWMRIAMGLALQEANKDQCAREFYEVLSTLRYTPSTPTLFHAGFPIAQLSSCFLTTIEDDLHHIFKCLGDNAQLAKWAGGIGTDWTNIRATGSRVKSIKATSQGVVPFLKIANDIVVAITKTGIRRGGTCVYLEVWHFDIEDFLDLRRNTGDERRRTHDMNTAVWVPDLFMKRVQEDGTWTLFSPEEAPDLHHIYGRAFEKTYQEYELQAQSGKLRQYKVISAQQLWRKMLSRLFETGHPWITFKDPCNIRSPQDHAGVIHSSNLCTEVTLNTSAQETAVCNLGSLNLSRHVSDGKLNTELLRSTIKTAVRMLDNVIDLNFYPTVEAQTSNSKHRPIGLGIMGFQDVLFKLNIPFDDARALELADNLGEYVAYYAIDASCDLARERGVYSSYYGSKWDRGIFPLDTIGLLEQERGVTIDVSRTSTQNWKGLKEKVRQYGMRNSNVMAVAPTATISNIAGCYPSIEPIFKNIYVKANICGEFTIINHYLVDELKKLSLWSQNMLDQIKYYDGDLANIAVLPASIKNKYKTAFELDPEWLIRITAVRGKWIDQSQSHNIFMRGTSGKKLHDIYFTAWRCGLKTLYYLRTLAASQIEKSTLDAAQFGFTQKRSYVFDITSTQESPDGREQQACNLDDQTCESCQ